MARWTYQFGRGYSPSFCQVRYRRPLCILIAFARNVRDYRIFAGQTSLGSFLGKFETRTFDVFDGYFLFFFFFFLETACEFLCASMNCRQDCRHGVVGSFLSTRRVKRFYAILIFKWPWKCAWKCINIYREYFIIEYICYIECRDICAWKYVDYIQEDICCKHIFNKKISNQRNRLLLS